MHGYGPLSKSKFICKASQKFARQVLHLKKPQAYLVPKPSVLPIFKARFALRDHFIAYSPLITIIGTFLNFSEHNNSFYIGNNDGLLKSCPQY